jgi:hypothetical protein
MAFIMMLAEGSMLDWSAVFFVDKAGMIQKNAGIGYTVFSIAMTMSRLGGHSIIQRLGRKWTISAGALGTSGSRWFHHGDVAGKSSGFGIWVCDDWARRSQCGSLNLLSRFGIGRSAREQYRMSRPSDTLGYSQVPP